jgi:regulatory helix-turn-helix LysR family protein
MLLLSLKGEAFGRRSSNLVLLRQRSTDKHQVFLPMQEARRLGMDLRRLYYFVVAADESNFRRASLRLNANSSVVSRYVRDIEEELGWLQELRRSLAALFADEVQSRLGVGDSARLRKGR